MKTKWLLLLFCGFVLGSGWSVAQAQNVTITPLGSITGEFCVGDRALLFEDPTGVRILTAPGRTVDGSHDPRLPDPADPSGGVHVLLIDHPHVDHIGDVRLTNCAGTTTAPFASPANGNAPEIAIGQKSAVLVGGEMPAFFTQKIKDVSGTAPGSCPVGKGCLVRPHGKNAVHVNYGEIRFVEFTLSCPFSEQAGATRPKHCKAIRKADDKTRLAPGITG